MVEQEDNRFILLHGEEVVARAEAASVDLEVPLPPTMEEAGRTIPESEIFVRHAFPTCFVCGPQRDAGDGLRIFAGPVAGRSYVAAPWIPDSSVTDSQGIVRDEIICAALDCPGAWAVFAEKLRVIVLGTLAVDIVQRMRAGDPCIVVGWKIGEEGRKLYAGTAIFSATGELYAKARATWIELK
jgi:acyl-coenzyme A thioesterase PaaI-like protein